MSYETMIGKHNKISYSRESNESNHFIDSQADNSYTLLFFFFFQKKIPTCFFENLSGKALAYVLRSSDVEVRYDDNHDNGLLPCPLPPKSPWSDCHKRKPTETGVKSNRSHTYTAYESSHRGRPIAGD